MLKKAKLTKRKAQKRLSFAQSKTKWTQKQWEQVVFSDEKKLRLFKANEGGNDYVRIAISERLKPNNVQPKVKFGGGGINFWGCVSKNGVGILKEIEGKLTGEKYKEILRECYKTSLQQMRIEGLLLEDNDPKHTSTVASNFKQNYQIARVENFPPCSPDLNVIENVWSYWEKKVHIRNPANLEELKKFAFEEWQSLNNEKEFFSSLVNSMPTRIEEVIVRNGWYTKY